MHPIAPRYPPTVPLQSLTRSTTPSPLAPRSLASSHPLARSFLPDPTRAPSTPSPPFSPPHFALTPPSHISSPSNTLDSHRLIEHAGKYALQDAVVEEVFKAYFEDEKNLGDRAVLEDIMVRLNVPTGDHADAAAWLKSDELEDEVKSDVRAWQKKHRVNGVPHFVLNGKHSLSGAQEAETFVDLFKQL